MSSNRILLIALFFALTLTACGAAQPSATETPAPTTPSATPIPPTATPPPSIAIVNGEYLSIAEFEAEVERYRAAQTALGRSANDAKTVVLDDLVAQILLSQAARKASLEADDADLQTRINALANQLGGADALRQWQSAHGYDEETFRAALKRSIESARMRDKIAADTPTSTEQIHLRQILTYNEADAQSALAELQAGADFDKLAARYDPLTGGELGWIPQGYLLDPKADEAAFALNVGETSAVIRTDAGFHIFKAVERGEHPLSPDALLLMQERALQNWITEQRQNGDIVILAP
ncbi:MAG: peptidylprolyl isomerase [Anaerolineales bacterium]|nr:peptidylprolyl isomerase [Anaerolineales bacterium]